MLDPDSPIPLYAQLLERLRQLIDSGELGPGDQFPTELDLVRDYGIARVTVRRAINELVRDGLLSRSPGKGSFVAAPKIERELVNVASFTSRMQALGAAVASRVVAVEVVPADARLSRLLAVRDGAPVVCIRRVRLANGEPVTIEASHLSLERCPGIDQEDFSRRSLYELLDAKYGLRPALSHKTLELTRAARDESRLLATTPGAPLFLLTATVLTADSAVMEYAEILCRGDRFRFQI